jgi:2-C-methyl-D-erythritol 4-phosphate cytidylyltransferase
MSKLTVIIPAAGKGSRLKLPYSKEILRVDEDSSLIDFSFNFFRD